MTGGTETALPPDLKDAMVAVVGAGIALAGLLLIFSGFLFAQAAVLPSDTSDKYLDGFKRRATIGLIPFTGALLVGLAALGYWVFPTPCYAHVIMFAFAVLVVATAVYGIWAIRLL